MIRNPQSAIEDNDKSGVCLYAPSKDNGAVIRLTACNKNDEKQMFYYKINGLLAVSTKHIYLWVTPRNRK